MSKTLFFQAIASVVAPWTLIYASQNAPRPAKPYVTMNVRIIEHPTTAVVSDLAANGEASMTEQVMFRIDLNFYGNGAMGKADSAATLFRYQTRIQAAHELGLAYSTIGVPTDIGTVLGHQQEERALLEVNGYAIKTGVDMLGLIETVEVEATTGDIVDTITIDSTPQPSEE